MYAFVDQPIDRLSSEGRFLLWAMRAWIHSAQNGRCPPGQLAPGFARAGALPALPPFHRLLAGLNRAARGELALAPLDHARVTEDEAVMLQLWHDAAAAPPRARATLALLVEPDAAEPVAEVLLLAAARLREAGFEPAVLADSSD